MQCKLKEIEGGWTVSVDVGGLVQGCTLMDVLQGAYQALRKDVAEQAQAQSADSSIAQAQEAKTKLVPLPTRVQALSAKAEPIEPEA